MVLKICFLLPIFITSFLSIASNSTVKALDKVPWDINDGKIIASWSEENIYIYAMDWKREEKENRGVYKEIILSVKGHERYFSCWEISTNPGFRPKFVLSDINNDGCKELIVISVGGTGTGVYPEDIHVFRVDSEGFLYDIYVVDPLEGIYQNVKEKLIIKNGIATIRINIKGNDYTMSVKESSLGFWGNEVGFGSIIRYSFVDNKLIVKVNALVGNGVSCGFIVMDYVFENKRLRINDVKFEKVNNIMFNYQF